jgi:hypothetical protein
MSTVEEPPEEQPEETAEETAEYLARRLNEMLAPMAAPPKPVIDDTAYFLAKQAHAEDAADERGLREMLATPTDEFNRSQARFDKDSDTR